MVETAIWAGGILGNSGQAWQSNKLAGAWAPEDFKKRTAKPAMTTYDWIFI